jgi:hypothetical protein
VVLTHETLLNLVSTLALGFGLAMIFQLVPFQRSTSVRAVEPSVDDDESPTAKQLVGLGHDTLNRLTSAAPFGVGLGTIDQAVPFHRSINVFALIDVDANDAVSPTAKQLVALEHATPFSST